MAAIRRWSCCSGRWAGPEPPARPIDLQLRAEGERRAANGGCNRLLGGFRLEGETIRISQLASTSMACAPELMALERRYSEALASVRREASTSSA